MHKVYFQNENRPFPGLQKDLGRETLEREPNGPRGKGIMKILVIGSLPPPLGGTSVSLQHLVNGLGKRDEVEIQVVDTSGIRGAKLLGIGRFGKNLWKIVRRTFVTDVVTLHVGLHALPVIGPFVWLVARLFRKPFLVRRFGGNDHQELRGWKLPLVRWTIRRADLYLVQTQALLKGAEQAGLKKLAWFPTSRPAPEAPLPVLARKRCRKFIFLSHIKPSKGIYEILSAAERFDDGVSVSVFGPFYDGLREGIFDGCRRVTYRGIASPEQVPQILCEHDALLLPTYYPGEGYPGALLEAFTVGLPVIATQWKSIPEIVDENCGILIPPQDPEALFRAMAELAENDVLYQQLCEGAWKQRKKFDSETWTLKFIEYCGNLIFGEPI